jgi:plastocyanin
MKTGTLAGGIVGLILLAGCSTSPESQSVDIRGFVFSPDSIAMDAGPRVMFVNRDFVPHTATARDGAWDTGEIAPGDSVAVAVAAGEFICTLHPNMKGMVSAR